MLIIKRIHVDFELKAAEAVRTLVERVHGFYADKCPVYRSLIGSIAMTSSVRLLDAADA